MLIESLRPTRCTPARSDRHELIFITATGRHHGRHPTLRFVWDELWLELWCGLLLLAAGVASVFSYLWYDLRNCVYHAAIDKVSD